MENTNSCSSGPDLCRCCLSNNGTWDLTVTYFTAGGAKENYSEILLECYGITLAYLTEFGVSHLVCTHCVSQLQDANSFKKRVLKAEERFKQHFKNKDILSEAAVKSETVTDYVAEPSNNIFHEKDADIDGDDYGFNKVVFSKEDSSKCDKTLNRQRLKAVCKKVNDDLDEYDSDTPIAEWCKKETTSTENGNNGMFPDKITLEHELQNKTEPETNSNDNDAQSQENAKIISERKRIKMTCDIVLNSTTACPFRHYRSWFRCFYCCIDFMEITPLRVHINQSHANVDGELRKIKRYPRSLQIDISQLTCLQCNVKLADVEAMRIHFSEIHNKVIYTECIADYKVERSPFECHVCSRAFHAFRALSAHINEHRANFVCEECGKGFLHARRLAAHRRTHERGHHPCSSCPRVFQSKSSKTNHFESVHSKRILKCHLCSKPMKHYNDRVKHMSEVHGITHTFKCPFCSREYNIKHYLASHIRQTHGNKNKTCIECGMAFVTNHALKKHMLKHSGQKPYSCDLCSKAFTRRHSLREHMKTHEVNMTGTDQEVG